MVYKNNCFNKTDLIGVNEHMQMCTYKTAAYSLSYLQFKDGGCGRESQILTLFIKKYHIGRVLPLSSAESSLLFSAFLYVLPFVYQVELY